MRRLIFVMLGLAVLFASADLTGFVSSSQAQGVDLKKTFRCAATDPAGIAKCDKARDLIVNNCTVCHTFVPIVMQKLDTHGWDSLLTRHIGAGRINQLSAKDVAAIHDYLTANFNGKLPPPEI